MDVKPLDLFHRMIAGEIDPPPIGDLIGLRMVAAEEGRVTFELDAGPQHTSPLGTVHGGILCDLADAAIGCAHGSLLGDGETYTTLELKIAYHKAMTTTTGQVRAIGSVISMGRRVAFAEARLVDAEGRLHASASSTLLVIERA